VEYNRKTRGRGEEREIERLVRKGELASDQGTVEVYIGTVIN
jgi:hypothetical protein